MATHLAPRLHFRSRSHRRGGWRARPMAPAMAGAAPFPRPASPARESMSAPTTTNCRAEAARFRTTPRSACGAPHPLDVLYSALLTNGYRSVNRALSSVAYLAGSEPAVQFASVRARRHARKAEGYGLSIHRGDLQAFWQV